VGGNMCSGRNTTFIPDAEVFLTKSPVRIGRVNIKARYVEYTDSTFATPKVCFCCRYKCGLRLIHATIASFLCLFLGNFG